MKISLICIGKTNKSFIIEGCETYEKRLKHYISFERIEIPDIKQAGAFSKEQVKVKEGELILKQIKNDDFVVLLDERGVNPTSEQFAEFINTKMTKSVKSLVFVVGGAYGFSDEVYSKKNHMVSLSNMVLPHQLIRIFFTEQLYRAFSIIKGEPYHHA